MSPVFHVRRCKLIITFMIRIWQFMYVDGLIRTRTGEIGVENPLGYLVGLWAITQVK